MDHVLLFVGTLVAIFAIVPVCTLLATGSARNAWEAAKGYGLVWGILIGLSAVGIVLEMAVDWVSS
jgi:hypothetical protein